MGIITNYPLTTILHTHSAPDGLEQRRISVLWQRSHNWWTWIEQVSVMCKWDFCITPSPSASDNTLQEEVSWATGWGELELNNVFFRCVNPRRLTVTYWRDPHPSVWAYWTHHPFKKKKDNMKLGGNAGWGNPRGLWEGGAMSEYDQSTMCVLRIFSKTK